MRVAPITLVKSCPGGIVAAELIDCLWKDFRRYAGCGERGYDSDIDIQVDV
jgi:hypothetical protein